MKTKRMQVTLFTLAMVMMSCREERIATTTPAPPPVEMQHEHAHSGPATSAAAPATPRPGASLASTILDPDQFDDPIVRSVYAKAKEVPDRLDQLYCYCHCSKNEMLKHKSLLSCFQSDHASTCQICMREAVQAWSDQQKGLDIEATKKAIDMIYGDGGASPHPHG
jgi:hypothetical protein